MTCNKQKITKHDRFGIFRSSLEIVMSGILRDDNYLYYKYGLFMGMEDKRLSHHYPCHTDMITYSLPAHKHNIPHFLEKLKKTIKTCEHWGLYKYLTRAMCKRRDDRMDPFAMDFDDEEEENIEMTDDNDFTDMTPPTVCFKRFMKYSYIYNFKRLQHSLSTTCAQWCIYYMWRKCQGWSLRNIVKPFYSKDFLINDHVLNLVVNNNFKINRKVIDKEFVKIQIARKTAEKNIHS